MSQCEKIRRITSSFYHRFPSSEFWLETIFFADGTTSSLGSNGGLSSNKSLHAVKSCSGSLSNQVASNKGLNLDQSF